MHFFFLVDMFLTTRLKLSENAELGRSYIVINLSHACNLSSARFFTTPFFDHNTKSSDQVENVVR